MTTPTRLSELTGDYVLDTAHTRIGFVARHTMATRVRGQFDHFKGSAHLDGDDPSKSGARLTIQAKSLQTRNERRDEQLRDTFLGMDDHPAITFTSTKVKQVDETTFEVTGDLTIRGVTKPVTVDFELTGAEHGPEGDVRVGFKGSATINRNDWGVNWNAATAVLVSPKVVLEFDVAAIRQS
ncbi:polyisoprenoid-binding protein YceI [Nonomuraea polychroma]|uniref:Polyisoprenoid-binding protein YceI n=1 Tax=Nonomuraea polychroma TaxID=46176 RepID=A0A438M4U7_9ACTN|nr:YceI family protein [Nonomuraea polychroma]RVX40876.1 polyisoprenoid-binding protein YceI [Nonomuraea polychroma]